MSFSLNTSIGIDDPSLNNYNDNLEFLALNRIKKNLVKSYFVILSNAKIVHSLYVK